MAPLPIAEDQDLLTKELNGLALATKIEQVEKPGDQPRPLAEQLDSGIPTPIPSYAKPPTVPHSAAADKVHSVAAGGKGYRVIVAGDYKTATPQGAKLENYEIPFNLPALTNAEGEAALAIIVRQSDPENSLLNRALKKKDPNFKHVHTHYVKSVTPLNGASEPTSLQYMSMESLSDYARQRSLGIDPADYWDKEHLRADIIYLITNFADNVDARTGQPLSPQIKDGKGLGVRISPLDVVKKRHQKRVDAKMLLDMNEGLGD